MSTKKELDLARRMATLERELIDFRDGGGLAETVVLAINDIVLFAVNENATHMKAYVESREPS